MPISRGKKHLANIFQSQTSARGSGVVLSERSNKYGLTQLKIEPEHENWENPAFLGKKFLADDLDKAYKFVKREHRKNSGYYDPPYNAKAFREAKTLFEEARESVLIFRAVDSAEEREGEYIIIEESDTPESFHNQLQTEKSYRDFVKNQSAFSKDGGIDR